MTVADYQPFVERMIFRYEGGYGWDKSDPGGPTKYGITCYDLAEFMHEKMDSMARWAPIVKAMTLATADQIYQQKYAVQCDFNDLMAGADCTVCALSRRPRGTDPDRFDLSDRSGPGLALGERASERPRRCAAGCDAARAVGCQYQGFDGGSSSPVDDERQARLDPAARRSLPGATQRRVQRHSAIARQGGSQWQSKILG